MVFSLYVQLINAGYQPDVWLFVILVTMLVVVVFYSRLRQLQA
jgi:hypothetical protein